MQCRAMSNSFVSSILFRIVFMFQRLPPLQSPTANVAHFSLWSGWVSHLLPQNKCGITASPGWTASNSSVPSICIPSAARVWHSTLHQRLEPALQLAGASITSDFKPSELIFRHRHWSLAMRQCKRLAQQLAAHGFDRLQVEFIPLPNCRPTCGSTAISSGDASPRLDLCLHKLLIHAQDAQDAQGPNAKC